MENIRIAAAQFEAADGDKDYNFSRIESLGRSAAAESAKLISFHECSISGYSFLEGLSREELFAIAEPVPTGPSTKRLIALADALNVTLAAGLLESDGERLFNTYIVVDRSGLLARHRKIHAFIHDEISCGQAYTVFEHLGCKFGILICYDNNLPENVRMTAMMGAEIVLMPHVTGCLPSPMPGRGTVAPEVWDNRELDPVRCRQEFDGPKGRGWIMRWLPARAYENGVWGVYTNPIGREGGTIKPGGSMILDPYGEVVAECRRLGDEVVVATLHAAKILRASGQGYIRARRPELYGMMVSPNPNVGPDGRPEVWWKKNRNHETDSQS
jgi:predicted amidohydrolase